MMCPLCQKVGAERFHQDQQREFFLCPGCTIIFVPRSSLLTPSEEKKRYDSHQNDESDPGYREYFLKTVRPVLKELRPGTRGLDFGCGRTRLMASLFEETGHEVDSYDPFYFPDEGIFQKKYDFAVLNEVIEHLRNPSGTLKSLRSVVSGPLFVRTKLYPATESEFANWFYKRDATHVQFWSLKALSVLGTVKVLAEDLYKIDWK
jgi:2-polyprenyl-3-methyl-5-hydroxy-6-metoxy-1,4-benzoquinol methylase